MLYFESNFTKYKNDNVQSHLNLLDDIKIDKL